MATMSNPSTPRVWHRFPGAVALACGLLCVPSIPVLPVIGAALLFSGLSQQAIAGTIYYVDGVNGNDSNPGTSSLAPKKTLPALAAGDTLYLAGRIYGTSTFTGSLTGGAASLVVSAPNVTIAQWPGAAQPELRGENKLQQTGWTPNGSAYELTLTGAPGTAPDGVVAGWDESVDANGRNYGHLVPETVIGNVTGATGNVGRYFYNTTTKKLTVYLPGGANPNTVGYPISICFIGSTNALTFATGADGWTVSGINFALYPTTANFGWSIIASCKNGLAIGCVGRDIGNHFIGGYGDPSDASGFQIVSCTNYGLHTSGSSFVFYQKSTTGNLSGCRGSNLLAHVYCYLDTTGARRDKQWANGSSFTFLDYKQGFICHSDTGTGITDVRWSDCNAVIYEDGDQMASAQNTAAPGTATDPTTYSAWYDRCNQTGPFGSLFNMRGNVMFRDCNLNFPTVGSSGLNPLGGTIGYFTIQDGNAAYFESCVINANFNGVAVQPICTANANSKFYFTNTSVYVNNPHATQGYHLLGNYTSGQFHVKGCAFGSSIPIHFLANDVGVGFVWDFADNAYHNIVAGGYSEDGTKNTQALWLANVDTAARFLGSAPFPNAPSNLGLTTASSLWAIKRTTGSPIPSNNRGINGGMYNLSQRYGAYQYVDATAVESSRAGLSDGLLPKAGMR